MSSFDKLQPFTQTREQKQEKPQFDVRKRPEIDRAALRKIHEKMEQPAQEKKNEAKAEAKVEVKQKKKQRVVREICCCGSPSCRIGPFEEQVQEVEEGQAPPPVDTSWKQKVPNFEKCSRPNIELTLAKIEGRPIDTKQFGACLNCPVRGSCDAQNAVAIRKLGL